MRPPPHHDEEWEEAVEFGEEPALVLARCGEYCGYGRYRLLPWVYYPGDAIPDFDLLNLEQIHRLRKKLYLKEDGRPLLRAPPHDEFRVLRQQLGFFLRAFQEVLCWYLRSWWLLFLADMLTSVQAIFNLLKPAEITEWDPISALLNDGPSPNPYWMALFIVWSHALMIGFWVFGFLSFILFIIFRIFLHMFHFIHFSYEFEYTLIYALMSPSSILLNWNTISLVECSPTCFFGYVSLLSVMGGFFTLCLSCSVAISVLLCSVICHFTSLLAPISSKAPSCIQ